MQARYRGSRKKNDLEGRSSSQSRRKGELLRPKDRGGNAMVLYQKEKTQPTAAGLSKKNLYLKANKKNDLGTTAKRCCLVWSSRGPRLQTGGTGTSLDSKKLQIPHGRKNSCLAFIDTGVVEIECIEGGRT